MYKQSSFFLLFFLFLEDAQSWRALASCELNYCPKLISDAHCMFFERFSPFGVVEGGFPKSIHLSTTKYSVLFKKTQHR